MSLMRRFERTRDISMRYTWIFTFQSCSHFSEQKGICNVFRKSFNNCIKYKLRYYILWKLLSIDTLTFTFTRYIYSYISTVCFYVGIKLLETLIVRCIQSTQKEKGIGRFAGKLCRFLQNLVGIKSFFFFREKPDAYAKYFILSLAWMTFHREVVSFIQAKRLNIKTSHSCFDVYRHHKGVVMLRSKFGISGRRKRSGCCTGKAR